MRTIELYASKAVGFKGRSIFWGDDTNDGQEPGLDLSPGSTQTRYVMFGYAFKPSFPGDYFNRVRWLMAWDASGIPRNAKILSATLKIKTEGWDPTLEVADPIKIAVYPADVIPWSELAGVDTYDGTNPWSRTMMKPGDDYLATAVDVLDVPHNLGDKQWMIWDITTLVQEAIDRDDMQVLTLIKPEDNFEFTAMDGYYWGTNPNLSFQGWECSTPDNSGEDRIPFVAVTYTDPMGIFISDEIGAIDESRQVYLGVGQYRIGSVVKDPDETSYQEAPAKLWVKNLLGNLTMKEVIVYSPPNWATFPDADDANTGNGTCSDVGTSPTLTIDEDWEIRMTSPTAFEVYRDSGTGDEPGVTQTWTLDGSGSAGTQYSSATRGVNFTLTVGGTAWISGDLFAFTSYKDFSIVGAAADSDQLLELCKDLDGSPDGNWHFARQAMTTISSQVTASSTVPVANALYFNPGNKIRIFRRPTETWSQEYNIQAVNKETNVLTLVESINADAGDWVHAVHLSFGDLTAGNSAPFWARGVSFASTTKEEKHQYLRAEEDI